MDDTTRTIAVLGATGRQGGAVARHLLARGAEVRAVTRRPDGAAARELAGAGAAVVQADLDDAASLRRAIEGADGVFSVQNGMVSGFEREVEQGRRVGDVAKELGVGHLVYASTAPATARTGVPSWDAKVEVESHLREIGLPLTILRPTAFMELMTDKGYYPAFGTWRIWPALTGDDRPVPWLAVDDLGAVAAHAFAHRDELVGEELTLAADVRSLSECRAAYERAAGRPPRSMPMPQWLFDRFTKRDVLAMWRWLRTGEVSLDTEPTRRIVPEALTVDAWLSREVGG